jgi:hypothetical protein
LVNRRFRQGEMQQLRGNDSGLGPTGWYFLVGLIG